jgi:GNAT superfamily N-acetyltransferase
MRYQIRPALAADIPGMHRVRLAVRENRLTTAAITPAHYGPAITDAGRGWVAVSQHDQASLEGGTGSLAMSDTAEMSHVLGFAVGNAQTGNIWALFVDPNAEGLGIGQALHAQMVAWLFAQGLTTLSLGTAAGTRAQRFYELAGWRFTGMANGEAQYTLSP